MFHADLLDHSGSEGRCFEFSQAYPKDDFI